MIVFRYGIWLAVLRWIGIVKLSGVRLGRAGLVGYLRPMTSPRDPLYAGYRYPADLISYAVWL